MNEDTRRLPALLTDSANQGAANKGAASNNAAANADNVNRLKAKDHVSQSNHLIIAASPGSASDSSSKPQRRRNKPSLSCETCTVSFHNNRFPFLNWNKKD